ncbi:MAG: HAMP domain-containing histidine kinase [Spirochaetia bacterium]|nr:HAMP domain-containing histidine kinase [Spirochaetia bacterium]
MLVVLALPVSISCQSDNTSVALHSRQFPLLCKPTCVPVLETIPVWTLETAGQTTTIQVPGYWSDAGHPARGFGVYHLRFHIKDGLQKAFSALAISEAPGAARILLNGEEIGKIGRLDRDPARGFEVVNSGVFAGSFRPGKNILSIEVSNYGARSGGLLGVRMGDLHQLTVENTRRLMREAALAGVQIFVAVLFLIIFAVSPKEPAYLHFAVFALLTGVHNAVSQGFLETIEPDHAWADLRLLVEYATGPLLPPVFFFLFLVAFIPGVKDPDLSRKSGLVLRGLVRAGYIYVIPLGPCILFACVLSGSASIYGQYQPDMVQLYMVPSCLIVAALVLIADLHRLPGAVEIAAGAVILAAAALYDALASFQASAALQVASMGTLALTLASGAALARERSRLMNANRRFALRTAAAHKELRRVDLSKDEFLLRIARTIQKDMNALLESATLLLSKPGAFHQEHLPHLGAVMDRAKHLTVECSRVEFYVRESRRMHGRVRVNLALLVRLEALLQSQRTGQEIDVQAEFDVPAVVDPEAIKLVVRELSQNASRFSKDTPLLIEIQSVRKGQLLRFTSGAGPASHTGAPGGLGLALVSRITEAHGGTCDVVDDRSSFVVSVRLGNARWDGSFSKNDVMQKPQFSLLDAAPRQ